ncbi:hypothetical protein DB347_03120 [Opitutaceae bacterium EW11]|nr:hypothetical protein DB347_03120 [Opitutaceae bacterium EW11]
MRAVVQAYYLAAYYLSWLWFGLGGLLLNVVCALLLLWPRREQLGHGVRSAIRWLFAFWLKWTHATGVFRVDWSGLDDAILTPGTVYVANHPTLVDAPVLLSRLPDAICIFKPALLKNPVIAPAAILAGYVSGDAGIDLIRGAAEQVSRGQTLLVFPEGTRTGPGRALEPFKPGFALIAQRAHAPIRLISLHASPRLVARGRPWWKPPAFPCRLRVVSEELLDVESGQSANEIARLAEERLASRASVVTTS